MFQIDGTLKAFYRRAMSSLGIWAGRCVLAATVAFALAGLLDPAQRITAVQVRGDRLNHALLSYILTLSLIVSVPRAPAWVLAASVVMIGVALEVVQGLGYFAGDAQFGDLAGDIIGVALAIAPLLLGKARAAAKAKLSEPS